MSINENERERERERADPMKKGLRRKVILKKDN